MSAQPITLLRRVLPRVQSDLSLPVRTNHILRAANVPTLLKSLPLVHDLARTAKALFLVRALTTHANLFSNSVRVEPMLTRVRTQ